MGAAIKEAVESFKLHMAEAIASSEALCLLPALAEKNITLLSSDNESFEVEEAVAVQSLTVKQVIEDHKIPLPVTGKILSKVVDYCKQPHDDDEDFKTQFVQEVDKETLTKLKEAAVFLKIDSLRDLTIEAVADMRKSLKHYKVLCPNDQSKIERVLDLHKPLLDTVQQTIVFVQSWSSAMGLQIALMSNHFLVGNTYTAPTSEVKDMILNAFKESKTHMLITDDEHLGDFDQEGVNLVINYDLPMKPDGSLDCEVYLKRADRAGRFGFKGGAVFNLLITDSSEEQMMDIIESHSAAQITEVGHLEFKSALEKACVYKNSLRDDSLV